MKFWRKAALVFLSMVALDVVFGWYVAAIAAKDVLAAASWAAAIQVCNVFVVSSYVKDPRLAGSCIVGAFVGTALAIQYL